MYPLISSYSISILFKLCDHLTRRQHDALYSVCPFVRPSVSCGLLNQDWEAEGRFQYDTQVSHSKSNRCHFEVGSLTVKVTKPHSAWVHNMTWRGHSIFKLDGRWPRYVYWVPQLKKFESYKSRSKSQYVAVIICPVLAYVIIGWSHEVQITNLMNNSRSMAYAPDDVILRSRFQKSRSQGRYRPYRVYMHHGFKSWCKYFFHCFSGRELARLNGQRTSQG